MKHIKKFENIDEHVNAEGKFWEINTDEPYFEISLNKLGFNEELKERIYDMNNYSIKNSGLVYIYIIKTNLSYIGTSVTWSHVTDFRKDTAIENGNKYMGKVEITEDDIRKWELINKAKKFNL